MQMNSFNKIFICISSLVPSHGELLKFRQVPGTVLGAGDVKQTWTGE